MTAIEIADKRSEQKFLNTSFLSNNSEKANFVLQDNEELIPAHEVIKTEENISVVQIQLTHLFNNINDVYAIFDLKKGEYIFVSDNIERLYNCKKETYINDTFYWKKSIYSEDLSRVEAQVADIIVSKLKGEIFYRIVTAGGEMKMVVEKLMVLQDNDGKAEKLFIVKNDYTNINNTEQSLIETERKFRFISENLSDFISIHDTDWNFTYASPSIKNILGFGCDEVLIMAYFDLVHPDDLLKAVNDCMQPIVLQKKEAQVRYRMLSKNGQYKWVETSAKPVIDSHKEISSIICSTRDVTAQVEAEFKLRESEEHYRLLSENSNDVIGIHNLEEQFLYISPSCKQVLGYEPSELLGKRPRDKYLNHEGLSVSVFEANKVTREKKEGKFLSRIVTKQGEKKILEVWLKPLFKSGTIIGFQSASRDVTEREQLLSDLEHSLAKEKELNELRQKFVSTASHQFRTPLTVIQSGVEIMDMYVEDLPQEKQLKFQNQFKKIKEEVARLEHLMNDVLLLGRANAARTPFAPTKQCIVTFCKHVIDNKYNNRYAADRQVIVDVKGNEMLVNFDEKLLGHSIENILNNAYKYSINGQIIFDIVFKSKQVIINIADYGFGIPEEDIKNLFQPFYRATNITEIEGTGLGLSIVKEFVEKHSGKIFLSSKLNKGTTVSVILPIE